jgi:lysophospholipase L1-like esterase
MAGEGAVIDSMDEATFKSDKCKVEALDGKVGKALKFTYDDKCSGHFATRILQPTAEWDAAAGFSFWVKGDGSDHLGGIQFIWNDDYAARYDVAFPIDGTEWKKITVAWRDLVPVFENAQSKLIDPKDGNAPSKLKIMMIGKWWYWQDYAACSFTIDDMRLEPKIDLDMNEYKPSGAPLQRVLDKLKAKKPVTIVLIGDSLTDLAHWANKPVNWPALLKAGIKEKYGVDPTIVNVAIGGTQLSQGPVIFPRWLKQAPEPDLVTVCYGGNDLEGKCTPEKFTELQKDMVTRVRRATKGKADVLVMTSLPAIVSWETMTPMADACKAAAKATSAGICDTNTAFKAAGKDNKEHLYGNLPGTTTCEGVHMGPPGHEVIAKTVIEAIGNAGK